MDSKGEVAGIIGVDFNADWYDGIVNSHRLVAIILTVAALAIGIVLSFVLMTQNRKRFNEMIKSISEIDNETQKLDNIILQTSIKKLDMLPDSGNEVLKTLATGEKGRKTSHTEYDAVALSLDGVCKKLKKYLRYLDSEVYIDPVTGVKNKAAYKIKISELDKRIVDGYAEFSVVFFDINGIKKIYTHFGFEAGDILMFSCAKILKEVFGKDNVYHITGDEFIVLSDIRSDEEMKKYFEKIDNKIDEFNKDNELHNKISVAKGYACFDFEKHKTYRNVFIDAKVACDHDKEEYYKEKLRQPEF